MVENQIDGNINTLRSNNGKELTSKEFKKLYRESGIKWELSTSYNHEHNSVAEWKNQTIMEVAKSMLYDHNIPMHLCAQATRTTVNVQSHTPHPVLDNKTLEESLSSFQFGSQPRIYIP